MECLFHLGNQGCTFDSHATASWLQFLGSMVALLLAIFLPEWNRRRGKRAEFLHVISGVTMLIDELKSMTQRLPGVIQVGEKDGKVSQIQHAYAKAANGILNQLNAVSLHDVHNSRILIAISLLSFGAEKAICEIVENWPDSSNHFGVHQVPDAVKVFVHVIEQVEEKLAKIPKP